MSTFGLKKQWFALAGLVALGLAALPAARAQTRSIPAPLTNPPMVLTVEGPNVWVQRFRSNTWESAYANQLLRERDRGRTGIRSRATIRLSDLSILRLAERSEFSIEPLTSGQPEAEFSLFKGLLYLLHRDKPSAHRFKTPGATAATLAA